MLGGPDEWTFWGTPNCGKGQPQQIGHTGHPGGAGPLPRDPRRGPGVATMTTPNAGPSRPRAMRARRAGARARSRAGGRRRGRGHRPPGRGGLTRFATGFIHQNVASEVNHVLIRVAIDGRNASTSIDGPADDETLGRAIDGVLEAARVRPPDPDWPGVAPPSSSAVSRVLQRAGVRLDLGRRQVTRDGDEIKLTPKELAVLEVLLVADGGVVSAEELLDRVWDEHTDPFTNTVRVTMMTLRRKLGDPPVIETVTGAGYRIR